MTDQIIIYGRGDKVSDEYEKINVTSTSKDEWARAFSPFFLGPVEVEPFIGEIYKVEIMENAWQYLKRFEGQDLKSWKKWSQEGFKQTKANRFPMGRGAKPLYSYWKGEKLGYIEARFKIYCPLYEYCIMTYAKDSFYKLKKMVDEGKKIALFDFDGYGYHSNNMTLDDVIYNPKKKMGHSFVLLGLLTNNKFWEKEYDKNKIKPLSCPRLK